MFKNMIREIVLEMWPELAEKLKKIVLIDLLMEIQQYHILNPDAQYMIVVRDDETAKALVEEINRRFSPETRIIVLAAADVQLLEIKKRR